MRMASRSGNRVGGAGEKEGGRLARDSARSVEPSHPPPTMIRVVTSDTRRSLRRTEK